MNEILNWFLWMIVFGVFVLRIRKEFITEADMQKQSERENAFNESVLRWNERMVKADERRLEKEKKRREKKNQNLKYDRPTNTK